jgi:hypothetical protein
MTTATLLIFAGVAIPLVLAWFANEFNWSLFDSKEHEL